MQIPSISLVVAISCLLARESLAGSRDLQYDQYHPKFPPYLANRDKSELSIDYWLNNARQTAHKLISSQPNNKRIAKNLILFLGDGMSIATVAMARIYAGGEEKTLAFSNFPNIGMAKTYCVDYQVPDSACTATAFLTGVKGNLQTIGVNGQVPIFDCTAELNKSTHTYSIAKWAMDAGKDAGLVTTTRVTHATPAGVYAHTSNRKREDDTGVSKDGCDPEIVEDIAKQLVHGEEGKRLKVVLGGGRWEFLHSDPDPETGRRGRRKDNRNLIQEWLDLGDGIENRTYVWNKQDLLEVDPKSTDRLLGLFEPNHCVFNLDRIRLGLQREPTLAEMVDKATDILKENEKGFFLFVEGGKIDHAHHSNMAKYALDETVEFAKAAELVGGKFSEEDTLIVVTSDHSHTVSFSGYSTRGSDVLGAAGVGNDQLPYMAINYATGMGYYTHRDTVKGSRKNIAEMDTVADDFQFPSMVPLKYAAHGGEDVAVYASGPWSHLFTGTYEQNAIPHMMAYAACIGEGLKACS